MWHKTTVKMVILKSRRMSRIESHEYCRPSTVSFCNKGGIVSSAGGQLAKKARVCFDLNIEERHSLEITPLANFDDRSLLQSVVIRLETMVENSEGEAKQVRTCRGTSRAAGGQVVVLIGWMTDTDES